MTSMTSVSSNDFASWGTPNDRIGARLKPTSYILLILVRSTGEEAEA
jgi:hypothetical protein